MMAKKAARGGSTFLRDTRGHTEVEWEIRNFLDQPYRKGESLKSPHFLLGDATWCIEIFPRGGMTMSGDDWISLFLCRTRGSGIHIVSFCIGIKAGSPYTNSLYSLSDFSKTGDHSGWQEFLQRSTISALLKGGASSDGAVTFVCTARLLDGRRTVTTQTSHQKSQNTEATSATSRTEGLQAFSKRFEELFICGNWSDIKIYVGEREFDVHKIVLRARSPVFAAMFDHEMAENISGVVHIPDMDPDSFRNFLLFIYTGQFSHVTSSNAVCLYKAADKYAVEELKEECNRRMVSDMSVESVLDVIPFAVTYGEDEILKIATKFFLENAGEILSTEYWVFFLEQNTPVANGLLIKMAKSWIAQRKVMEL